MAGFDNPVLVVEDEPDGQEVIAEMLGFFNIAVDAVETGEEALELLNSYEYACIVIDLHLPNMDGWELLQHIRGDIRLRNVPCVAVTAYHSSAVRQEALEHGFDAYFSKPIEQTSFVRELKRMVGNGNGNGG